MAVLDNDDRRKYSRVGFATQIIIDLKTDETQVRLEGNSKDLSLKGVFVSTDKRLQRALHRVDLLQTEIADYYGNYKVSNDLLELRNLAMVAELMIRCAISRQESRGLHYTLDYPQSMPVARDTILQPGVSAP